ncbi:MAG: carbohydrate ABC transporter permease, partial [Fimbriimonadales bacterium]|nr:carbohydrate ABC transporter permease [Fimbriimonadales bacterium]
MVRLIRGATMVVLLLIAAITFTPLIWLLAASLKAPEDLFSYTFFSPNPSLKNFYDLFTQVDFLRFFANSTFIACAGVVIQLFFSSLAGYALAKYDFKGKQAITILMLATLLIPGQVTLAPTYELIYRMGLVDTYAGLLVPGAVSVFGIFLFRQAMLSVPTELIHAARIDGCSEFQIYWQVVMPTVRPMVGAFVLIAFMGQWNSFLWPQIILHSAERFTLPIALTQMVGIYQQQYGMLMAGTLLSILPVMALFLFLQREFVAGLTAG